MRLMLYILLLILGGCAKRDKQPQEKTPAQGVVNESVDDWQASWLKDLEEYYNSLAKRVYPLASDVQALKKRLESQQYWKIVNYRPGRVVDGKVYFYYDVVNIGGASRMMMHIRGDSISYYSIFDDEPPFAEDSAIGGRRSNDDGILFCSGDSIAIGRLKGLPEKELNIYQISILLPATRQAWISFQCESERLMKKAEEQREQFGY